MRPDRIGGGSAELGANIPPMGVFSIIRTAV